MAINNHPLFLSKVHCEKGITLVELIIALCISGSVIAMTLFSWTFLAKHTESQKNKSQFYAQTEDLVSRIVNDIRTSPEILEIKDHGITFVSSLSQDTITYCFENDSLRRNNVGIVLLAQCANVKEFTLDKSKVTSSPFPKTLSPGQKQPDIVLAVTLEMQDCFSHKSKLVSQVKIRPPIELREKSSTSWNF